jgi:cbb3-type cytochrome oxidase subunit 3
MGQDIIISIATIVLIVTGLLLGYILSQLVLGFLSLSLLTFLGTLSLIVIFGTLYYVLFWEFRKRQNPSFVDGKMQPIQDYADDSHLKNKLTTMLAGDSAAAHRLVEQAREEFPGMPEYWYWERTIADLERERR